MINFFEPDNRIDDEEWVRKAAIARLAQFIEQHLYDTNWTLLASMAGVEHILDAPRHERVRRAQSFGDSDYPDAIYRFLKEVFELDERRGLFLVGEIAKQGSIQNGGLSEEARAELKQILSMFSGNDIDATLDALPSLIVEKLIKVKWVPDDFYNKLISEINRAYANQMPMALSVLIRKLLENLVIDVLRKKYGTAALTLYYDPSRRRFNDFSVLLRNLDAQKDDFGYITSSLDSSFIRALNQYRETGNAGAHSIDTRLTIEWFVENKGNINYLVQLLLRILQQLDFSTEVGSS